MNRPAVGTMVTTSLVGIAGVLAWLFWLGDPCLGTEIANHWRAKNPPSIAPLHDAGPTDEVVIENPYGIMTCHDWPTAADHVLNLSAFVFVAFAIGWMAAWRIRQRPLLAAAAITTMAMLVGLSLQYWARWESIAAVHSAEGQRLLGLTALASLVFFLVAASIAMSGAWIALRFTRRR